MALFWELNRRRKAVLKLAARAEQVNDLSVAIQRQAHHEGAIEMAKTVLADGKNAETLALSQAIISGQELEIETLRSL